MAIKLLQADLAASLGAERFLREIKLAARQQHPHIPPVFDSGESEGLLWYGMPFVDGDSLRRTAGLLGGRLLMERGVIGREERILVADFASAADPSLGSALTEALRVDLGQLRGIGVVQPEQVRLTLRRMQRDSTGGRPAVTALEVAQRDGIKAVVLGDVTRAGPSYGLAALQTDRR